MQANDLIDKLAAQRVENEKRATIQAERAEEYKRALNNSLGSEDGIFILRHLIKYMGVFSEGSLDAVKLLDERGKKSVYLNMIRPYLDKDVLHKVELNQDLYGN